MELAGLVVLAPLALATVAGSLSPAAGGARPGEIPWDPLPCRAATATPSGIAWYRLDTVLDGSGTLAGRRLSLGTGDGAERSMDLAPESFASGPVDGLLVSGEDDGTVSRVRLLDAARGCAVAVGETPDVVRSAVLAPGAGHLFEHRVDRATRADLGVWRREIGGSASHVVAGLDPDAGFGPTFTTDLVLADDGRLVVSSCGQAACRVRVVDPGTGEVTLVQGTGPALGVTGGDLVTRAVCPWEPCPVDAVDLGSGERRRLAADAFAAVLGGPNLGHLVVEVPGGRVAAIEVATGRRTPSVGAGGIPVRAGSTASAGAADRGGGVVLAPGGRPTALGLERLDPAMLAISAGEEVVR